MRKVIAAILLVGAAAPAGAADDPICASRPGKATPTCTVEQGHWQVETGFADWSLQKDVGERDTQLALGETMVRYGLTDASEIAVDVTPWQRAGNVSGFGDVQLFYKQRLTAEKAPVQVAVAPFVKLPTAKHELGNGKVEGGVMLPIDGGIGHSALSFDLTPEMDWVADGDGHGHHPAMVQVAGLGWQASERLNLSAELWRQWDWDPAGTTRQASVDGSLAYLLGKDAQVDAGANFGLNRATPDIEIYAGLSKRF